MRLLIVVMALCGVAPAVAQEPASVPLTVEDAVARALEASQRLAEARARQVGTQAAIDAREAARRPTIALSGGYTRTNHVDEFGVTQPNGMLRVIYPDIPDNYFTRASLQWPIYTAGRVDALVRAAAAEARAAGADVRAARADLRLEVERAYWALVTATESVRVVQEALGRADAHLRDVRSRLESGLISPNEVTAAEAQRARQELQLIEARNLRAGVVEDLRRLTGITGEPVPTEPLPASAPEVAEVAIVPGPTAPPGPTAAPGANAPSGPTAVPGLSVPGPTDRAEQEALRARREAAEARVEAIAAGRRPTIAITGAADYANPNPRIFPRRDTWQTSWEAGVVATWTLFDGGRVAAETAEAAAAVRALQARQADLDALIATEVRQRQLDLESARAALRAAAAGIRSAEETRRVVGERFDVGVATSTEVLDADVALLQAALDRTRALAAIRLAEARLARARGR